MKDMETSGYWSSPVLVLAKAARPMLILPLPEGLSLRYRLEGPTEKQKLDAVNVNGVLVLPNVTELI